jgi:hypothetical protein
MSKRDPEPLAGARSLPAAATLTDLREQNRHRGRPIRHLREVSTLRPRPIVELLIELATKIDVLSLHEDLARRFADDLVSDVLRAINGHDARPEGLASPAETADERNLGRAQRDQCGLPGLRRSARPTDFRRGEAAVWGFRLGGDTTA